MSAHVIAAPVKAPLVAVPVITASVMTRRPSVRAVRDGRPPCQTWVRHATPSPDQPRLDQQLLGLEVATELHPTEVAPPARPDQRVLVNTHTWVAEVRPGLPDPQDWSASIAQGIVEVLHGRRPASQLSRWVDDVVLATLNAGSNRWRRAGSATSTPVRPPRLQSVHLQYPASDAVEASAHVRVGARSVAFAFRLEAWGERWLCTALELGPTGSLTEPRR